MGVLVSLYKQKNKGSAPHTLNSPPYTLTLLVLFVFIFIKVTLNPPPAMAILRHPYSPEVCLFSHTLSNDFHAHQNGLLTLPSGKPDVGLSHQTPQGTRKFAARSFLLNGREMLFLPKVEMCPNSGDTLLCLTLPDTKLFKY